jgi:hypothetical protein
MWLLPGYRHERFDRIDSSPGRIWKEGGLEICYDIGGLAGNYVKGKVSKEKDKLVWHKEQTVAGRTVQLCLTKDRVLFATVGGTANFWAKVKSDEDTADLLLMVVTYNAPEARKQGHFAPTVVGRFGIFTVMPVPRFRV